MTILPSLIIVLTGYVTVTLEAVGDQNGIHNQIITYLDRPEHSYCPGCSNIKAEIDDIELAELRVEFIKQQILKKLKLKEVPRVSPPANKLPIPILTRNMYRNAARNTLHDQDFQEDDDFFGKTNQVILFPEESSKCEDKVRPASNYPVACFTFFLPTDLDVDDIAETDLWVYKTKDFLDEDTRVNHTFIYSEILEPDTPDGSPTIYTLESHTTEIEEGWIKLAFVKSIKKWLEAIRRRHTIQVLCKTCGYSRPSTPVSIESKNQPFLVINTETNRKKRRPKRNVNCMPGISECCREKLYISFADIGWDDWIIQPRGYEAYFCRGSCSNAASLTLSGTPYSSMIRKLIQDGKKLELSPCCTATHLSSIQLIFMYDNNTITQKTLPNMTIESCGCM
ncbi:UNVERIFIED_CONTAM: hypothetical protein PYX00_009974 [Menopon gallinae]|uniref:TGF-beta family profile domain-containing protein n=1 Tax=Menopon gallinae TaxID=328185 RepID=A0AAW2HE20_9NEOP